MPGGAPCLGKGRLFPSQRPAGWCRLASQSFRSLLSAAAPRRRREGTAHRRVDFPASAGAAFAGQKRTGTAARGRQERETDLMQPFGLSLTRALGMAALGLSLALPGLARAQQAPAAAANTFDAVKS